MQAAERSRPAAIALVAIGAVVLAFSLIRDVPKANETGLVGLQYEEAEAKAGSGLYLEIAGCGADPAERAGPAQTAWSQPFPAR